MPHLGEIRYGREIGYKSTHKFIYAACLDCHKERWVRLDRVPAHPRCHSCAASLIMKGRDKYGRNNPNWKGGEKKSRGYVFVLKREHPQAYITGYIKRARLILEAKLGRYLLPGMDVHHRNEVKDDDRPENLEELSRGEHNTRRKKPRGILSQELV